MQERQDILGVKISITNLDQCVETIQAWITQGGKQYVCVAPGHSVMDCQDDPKLRNIFNNSGMTTPDGMSIVWALKAAGHRDVTRVYGPDLMLRVCQISQDAGFIQYLYGGERLVLEALKRNLTDRFPKLKIAGTYSPAFREIGFHEDPAVINQINESGADLIWVGLGSPKQEYWMAQHRELLQAPVIIAVGAAFDFLSGAKKQAPRWVQRSGMEWLFRFLHEPARLWKRYRRYPRFVSLLIRQFLT